MEKTKNVVIEIILSSATGRNRLQGVFEFLRGRADWNIRLPQTRREFEQALREPVDGIIASRVYSSELLRRLETGSVPVVFMDIDRQDRRQRRAIDITIANDNGGVGLAAARYLLSLGRFRAYGYVPFTTPTPWSLRRGEAFAVMIRRAGETVNVFDPAQAELSGWLRNLPKPAALFCACDAVSRKVVDACRAAHVRIPSQAVVLGVDNDELICQISRPELSSVRLDTQGEGFEAAKALHTLMKGGGQSRTILMKPLGIAERTSTNPPPPAAHLVETALEFIAKNAVKGITPDDVARHMNCSRRLLDLRFAKYHDESVHSALVRTRLAAVRRELTHSNQKLHLIAQECGFKNAAVLKNLFRKTYGLSMREYRKAHGLRK